MEGSDRFAPVVCHDGSHRSVQEAFVGFLQWTPAPPEGTDLRGTDAPDLDVPVDFIDRFAGIEILV